MSIIVDIYKNLKILYKRNSHNALTKALSGFGRAMNRLYENRNHNIYSNGEVEILKKISKRNPEVIFDVGANVGNYAMEVIRFCPKSKIYAFEPVATTFEELQNNLDFEDRVHLMNKGLSDTNDKIEFFIYEGSEHTSHFEIEGEEFENKDSVTLDVVKGDDFMDTENIDHIDLLKIDVEGAEMKVLNGFRQALQNKQIDIIQFEYGYINITTNILLKDYFRFLNDFGYEVGKIYPKSVDFREYQYKHENFIESNYLAVNRDKKEIIDLLS